MKQLLTTFTFIISILILPYYVKAIKIAVGASNPHSGTNLERTQLINTLNELGFDVGIYNNVQDAYSDGARCWIDFPGCGNESNGIGDYIYNNLMGFVKIGDWGGFNIWPIRVFTIPEGLTISVFNTNLAHPITRNLPSIWVSYGFWRYGFTNADYIAYPVQGGEDLIMVTDFNYWLNGACSSGNYGTGRLVFVGWNIYGSYAHNNDKTLLRNIINWVTENLYTPTPSPTYTPTPSPTFSPTPTSSPTPTISPTPTNTPTPPPLISLNFYGTLIILFIFLIIFMNNKKAF